MFGVETTSFTGVSGGHILYRDDLGIIHPYSLSATCTLRLTDSSRGSSVVQGLQAGGSSLRNRLKLSWARDHLAPAF